MKKSLLAVSVLIWMALPAPAGAENWQLLAEDAYKIPVFYDLDSMEKKNSQVYSFWTKITNQKTGLPIRDYESYDEARHLIELDCTLRIYRIMKGEIIDKNGGVAVVYIKKPGEWTEIQARTLGDLFEQAICKEDTAKK